MLPRVSSNVWSSFQSIVTHIYKSLTSKSRWKLEGQMLWRRRQFSFLLCLIQFVHIRMTNVAYKRHVQGERLKDLGFDLIPDISSEYAHLSDYLCLMVLIIVIPISFFAPFFHKSPPVYSTVLLLRCVFVMSLCIILRILSFLSTSLPGPAAHCQPNSMVYNPPQNMRDLLFRQDVVNGCGDLIFSGHTTYTLCLIISFYIYEKSLLPKKLYQAMLYFFLIPIQILMMILIIAARKHYTVDIVVAIYTVPMVYYTSYYLLSDEDLSGMKRKESSSSTSSEYVDCAKECKKLNVE